MMILALTIQNQTQTQAPLPKLIAKLCTKARLLQAKGLTDEVRAEKERDHKLERPRLLIQTNELKFKRGLLNR
jgi:hypothetical protein